MVEFLFTYGGMVMKEKLMAFLEIINGLLKYPMVFGFVVFAFVLSLIQEVFPTKGWIQCIQLIGIIIFAAFCAVILLTNKNGRKYINKIVIFSLFWFASCIVLVDFSKFGLEWIVRIIASYEFIFLGCLIPDFVSQIEREHDDTIRKLEERISILEKNQSHSS